MAKKNYTINDLARRLGISKSTVSRALKDHPDVGMATRKKVKDLAKELNYQPNVLASNLASRHSKIIGVVVPEIARQHFFASALQGIEQVAKKSGYTIMICQSNETEEEEIQQTQILRNNRVAGLLVSLSRETRNYEHLLSIKNSGTPVVLFDRVAEELNVSQVMVDDEKGAYEITKHLLEQGYKDIAHLSGPMNLSISRKRYNGFIRAIKEFGQSVSDTYVYECNRLSQDTKEAIDKLLTSERRPQAIFAMHDYIAIITVQYLQEKGFKVPEDIAVAGFAGDPVTNIITPKVTTMHQPAYEIGEYATQQLIKEIESEDEIPSVQKVFATTLQVKASTVKGAKVV